MIPLEIVLLIINGVRNDAIEMIANPVGRDGFAYGQAHGWMQAANAFQERLNAAVEEKETANRNSERRANNDSSEEITDEDDYQL